MPQNVTGGGGKLPSPEEQLPGQGGTTFWMRQDLPGSAPLASCWGCGSCDSVLLSSLQIDGKSN